MWRTSKEIALKQITIPEQKVQDYWIEFTPVERYFYEREHDVRYSDFMRKLKSFDPDMPLRALDKREFKEVRIEISFINKCYLCDHFRFGALFSP